MRSYIKTPNHHTAYQIGLMLLAVGLPLSNFLMSFAQFFLAANWLLEGHIKPKCKKFIANRPAVIFTSIFFMSLLGLAYSFDFNYAFNDIRTKLPLFILPFIIASSAPLTSKQLNLVMLVFTGSVLLGTFAGILELIGFNNFLRASFGIKEKVLLDARLVSLFISHIRFSLMICLSIFWLGFYFFSQKPVKIMAKSFLHQREFNFRNLFRFSIIAVILWLIAFMIIMESITGLSVFLLINCLLLGYRAWVCKSRFGKCLYGSGLMLATLLLSGYLFNLTKAFYTEDKSSFQNLDPFTAYGNAYFHDLNNRQTENGHYVWIYVCKKELEPAWNLQSNINFNEKDRMGQDIEFTLLRFLTSKGLRKDAGGIAALNEEEINAIENGIANVQFTGVSSLSSRINGIIWEIDFYIHGGNPGGHSVTQRIEFWKTAVAALRNNPLIGVGTGDVFKSMQTQYEAGNSPLAKKFRQKPHNQYLSIAVAYGIIGLAWFIFAFFYPPIYYSHSLGLCVGSSTGGSTGVGLEFPFVAFFLITLFSMIAEDTLETQAGVSFVSFFYALFLFSKHR